MTGHPGPAGAVPLDALIGRIDAASARLAGLAASSSGELALGLHLVEDISTELSDVVAEQLSQQSAVAARLLAVRDRFDSHVLASWLLEASEASSASAFNVLTRGLVDLAKELRGVAVDARMPSFVGH